MASKSLGTLTIDLIAEVGGFVKGMDKAERASEKWRKKVESDVKEASAAVAGIAGIAVAASAAMAGAGLSLLKSTSEQITETDRWAKSLGTSTQSLLEWQYAAKQAGLSGDNIADIFKDLNDKIGDAVLNKSGDAAQALDTLGLSAKKLQEVSPDKQLLAIANAMRGMNTAQKTNILESLGNDLSKMLPLFDNGNEKLNKFIQQAKDFGVAPPQEDIDKLVKVNSVFQDIEGSWDGFKTTMATGLADIDLDPLVNSVHSLEKTFTDPAVLQGIANIVTGLTKVVDLLGHGAKLANDMAYGWGKTASTTTDSSFNDLLAKRKELNDSLAYSESFLGKIDAAAGVIRSSEAIRTEIAKNETLISNFKDKSTLPVGKATVGTEPFKLDNGDTNQTHKPPKTKTDHAALKLDNSFKSTEQAYLRQISLIDTTGKKTAIVTEQQKLAFDLSTGKLNGLNAAQQERLKSLATEVDRLNQVKKANEDNAKVAAYIASLQQSNANNKQGLDADFIGAGMGDKTRDRLKEMASIRQDFANQQFDLNKQYSETGDKDLYDKQTAALNDALDERLKDQEDYYSKIDDLQSDWQAGVQDGLQNFVDNNSDYMQQAASATESVLEGLSSSITDNLMSTLEGTESFSDGMKNILRDLTKNIIEDLISIAAKALVVNAITGLGGYLSGGIFGGLFGGAAGGNAGTALSGIGSSLDLGVNLPGFSGMAHDGIDSVPETGTWLLQKGERVTTAQTSAKLDATLDRVATQSTGGGSTYAPVQHIKINGNPSDATIALVRQAAKDGADQGYRKAVNSIGTRTGDLHNALMARTNAGVRKR